MWLEPQHTAGAMRPEAGKGHVLQAWVLCPGSGGAAGGSQVGVQACSDVPRHGS